ncbi:Spo75 protein [Saccharomycopsis crataegensis]|uniref:Spo75 protein n=1 Tax=Saccharomycopsis crataegensis TaxID=43959 RepID=A0AAV5QNH2_9ASCO|nr:Spo75 protein [Saccharomycopsis crataegensis]
MIQSRNSTDLGIPHYNISLFHFLYIGDPSSLLAHRSSGVSIKTFLSSLIFSIVLTIVQIFLFSYLRPKAPQIYQPRSFYVEDKHKVERLSEKFFGWVIPSISYDISEYIELSGLDAYFCLRFLRFLVIISLILAVINVPVLLPINYTGSTGDSRVHGLDRLTWSNIAPNKATHFNFHFILAIITIIITHYLIFYELRMFIKVRHNFILKNRDAESVMMIDNIPEYYKQIYLENNLRSNPLLSSLNCLPGKIKNIWFIYRFTELEVLHERSKSLLRSLEKLETEILTNNWKFYRNQDILTNLVIANSSNISTPIVIELESMNRDDLVIQQALQDNQKQISARKKRFQRSYLLFKWGEIEINIPFFGEEIDMVDLLIQKYLENKEAFLEMRNILLNDRIPCYHKMFVQFNNKVSAYIAKQILLSSDPNKSNFKVIEINPKDIIWNNVQLNNFWLKKFRYFTSNALKLFLVIFWTIPTMMIGSFSQMEYFTFAFPLFSWIDTSSNTVKNFISGVFPALSLIIITELIPIIFRWLSILKGKLTGAEVEIDIQNWCFTFFFIHVFLIVTVSSSVTAIFENFINNPVSLPTLLATNIPKASNFFLSFILLRGLAYAGSNMLQPYLLLKNFIFNPLLRPMTPREKFKQISNLESLQWGSIYPIYSILGSLSIIFSVIAPLILICSAASFILIFISFKYSLKFCHSPTNYSETYGKFYPVALNQLYYGIYCLEICLVGLFLFVRNENDDSICFKHSAFMVLIFSISTCTHIYINNSYNSASHYLPLEYLNEENIIGKCGKQTEIKISSISCVDQNLTFSHPSFDYDVTKDFIWLPRDKYGNSSKEIEYLRSKGIQATNKNCILNDKGEIMINGFPKLAE